MAFLCVPILAHSENIIQGKSCYTYGDSESMKAAREMVRSMALRDALESSGIFLYSESTTKNFVLKEDSVRILSSGTLKNIQIVEHVEEGRKICETIEASFVPGSQERGVMKTAGPVDSEYGNEEKKICAAVEPGLEPGRGEQGLRTLIPTRGQGRNSFVRILQSWQESHVIIIKTECLKDYDRDPMVSPARHPENRLGITYCTPEGGVKDLWLSPCGKKGEIKFFQFRMPQYATFSRCWVGN